MAEFQMVAKNLERMCNTYRSLSKCGTDECLLYCEDLCYAGMMIHVHGDDAGRLEDAVMAWAAEHPEPVYPTWWEYLEKIFDPEVTKYPNDYRMFGEACERYHIPVDIAQKLGIEPK